MKNNQPLISIITVVYNGEEHLEQTMKSVIKQTYKNIEYIIIDGASTDGTLDLIKEYEKSLSFWVSEKDNGIYDAMNKGIELATGEFIAFINADDWYADNAINNFVHGYNKNQNIDFFYGNLNFIKENGEIILWRGNKGFKGLEIPHPTCFIRSSIMKQAPFDTNLKIAADAELTLRLFHSNVKFFYIDEVIANFRDGGASSCFWLTQKENFQVLSKYIGFGYAIKSFLKKSLVSMLDFIKEK